MRQALVEASLQGLVAFLAVWAVCRWVRLPTSWQVWLWRGVHLKLLVSTFWILPLPLLPSEPSRPPKQPLTLDSPLPPAASLTVAPTMSAEPKPRSVDPVVLIWATGATGMLVRGIRSGQETRRRLRRARPCEDDRAQRIWSSLGRREPLLQSAEVASPLVAGPWRSRALVPSGWLSLADNVSLELALAHEAAHLRRRDLLWQVPAALCQLIFWFLPFVPIANRRLRESTEAACDAEALRRCRAAPAQLAELLVALPAPPKAFPAALPMAAADAETLKRRIQSMFHPVHRPKPGVAIAVFVAATGALVPWQAVAQAPAPDTYSDRQLQRVARSLTVLEAIDREIALSETQQTAMKRASEAAYRRIRNHGNALQALAQRGASNRERQNLDRLERERIYRENDGEFWAVYNPSQQRRMIELALQYVGGSALSYPSVQEALGLTPDQRRRVSEAVAELRRHQSDRHPPMTVQIRKPTERERRILAQIRRELPDATGERRRSLIQREAMIRMRFERPGLTTRMVTLRTPSGETERTARWVDIRSGKTMPDGQTIRRTERQEWKNLGERLLASLTNAQRDRWNAMLGERFPFPPGDLASWAAARHGRAQP